jgi:hypothetical protein
MAGAFLSWTGDAQVNVPFRSVIEIKPKRRSWVELPLESKSSSIPRINSTTAIVFEFVSKANYFLIARLEALKVF